MERCHVDNKMRLLTAAFRQAAWIQNPNGLISSLMVQRQVCGPATSTFSNQEELPAVRQ